MAGTEYTVFGSPTQNSEIKGDEFFTQSDLAAITLVAENMQAILLLVENQGWITESAANAAAAAVAATSAENTYETFTDIFLGNYPTPPAQTPNGNPINAGMFYFNTIATNLQYYNGIAWQVSVGSGEGGAIEEPTNDGNIYGRVTDAENTSSWERVAPFGHQHSIADINTLTDVLEGLAAAIDDVLPDPGTPSGLFLRDDMTWTAAGGGGGGISEAPNDGAYYGRRNLNWAAVAAATHTHAISDVTGLQTALDGKSGVDHDHAAFNDTSPGFVPAPNGDTGHLKHDGTWEDPIKALGGLTDDVLITSPANGQGLFYDSTSQKWKNVNPPSGGNGGDLPSGGNNGDVVSKVAGVPAWAVPHYIPVGGNTNDVLKKNSGNDYDVVWGAGGGGGVSFPIYDVAADGQFVLGPANWEELDDALANPTKSTMILWTDPGVDSSYALRLYLSKLGDDFIHMVNEQGKRVGAYYTTADGKFAFDTFKTDGATLVSTLNETGLKLGAGTGPNGTTELLRINGGINIQGTVTAGPTAGEIWTNPLQIGAVRLWDDGTKIRAKRGADPANANDGTVLW